MHQPPLVERRSLVVLGDQTGNVSGLLKAFLLGVPSSAAQTEFVRDASALLGIQASDLRPFQRERLPAFRNIHDLARVYEQSNGVCHPSIGGVALCVTQLLQLFRYCILASICAWSCWLTHSRETDTSRAEVADPSPINTRPSLAYAQGHLLLRCSLHHALWTTSRPLQCRQSRWPSN